MTRSHYTHLIVGSQLLGLALGDHLLRRGAEGVALLDTASLAPPARAVTDPGVVLSTQAPLLRRWERRSLLLLEEWQSYLGQDPHYDRCGVLTLGPELPTIADEEQLGSSELADRYPQLHPPDSWQGSFARDGGLLDPVALTSALYSRVRSQGGRVLFNSELHQLSRDGAGYSFETSGRSGTADHLYFTDEISGLRWLSQLEVRFAPRVETWHCFSLQNTGHGGSRELQRLYRLERPVPEPADSADLLSDGLLEGGVLEDDSNRAQQESELALLVIDGAQRVTALIPGGAGSLRGDLPVSWDLLEQARAQWGEACPLLEGRAQRGHSFVRLSLAHPFDIVRADEGRLQVAGAFGIFSTLLSLSVAESMAESALGLPSTLDSDE